MFRLLIIEDMKGTLTQLELLLAETFVESLIDKAETVRQARALIEQAYQAQRPYHAVILDFMLPRDIGENPEADESVCELLRQKMSQALIAHITSYPEDTKVQEHLRRAHVEEFGHMAFAHSKVRARWAIELIQKLKAYLHGKRILGRTRLLFSKAGVSSNTDFAWSHRSHIRAAGGATHEIADLSRDIAAHWRDLDEQAQDEIKQVFRVDEAEDIVRVGLL